MDSITAKANEKQLFEHVNNRNLNAINHWIDEHIAVDYINHSTLFDVSPDREGLKIMFRMLIELFPEVKLIIEEMVFEDDLLCFQYKMSIADNTEAVKGLAMAKFNDNKITHRWAFSDTK